MQLSPARGRLLNQAGLGILKNAMQLSAARGRLPRVDRKVTFDAGCSLAPRGDGYFHRSRIALMEEDAG